MPILQRMGMTVATSHWLTVVEYSFSMKSFAHPLGVVMASSSTQSSLKNATGMRENKSQCATLSGEEGVTPLLRGVEDLCKELVQL